VAAISRLRPPSATTHAATFAACPPRVRLVLAAVSVSAATVLAANGPDRLTTTSR
jgi:hypothetical protein